MFLEIALQIVLVLIPTLFHALTTRAQKTAIKAGHVFDVYSGEFLKNKLIMVEGQTIIDVQNQPETIEADEIIDLSNA